jgi:hypothetical protein
MRRVAALAVLRRVGAVVRGTLLLGWIAGAEPARAQSVVIDFEDLACAGAGGGAFGGPYLSSGFSFATTTSNVFGRWCTGSPHLAGSTSLFNNNASGTSTTLLAKVGGGAFSLFSIRLAHIFSGAYGPLTVTFSGIRPNSSTVFQSFVIPSNSGTPILTQFQFSSAFQNVTSVSWNQGTLTTGHQFDDVSANLSAVPEPATVGLVAVGLIGVAGAGYLRRRRSNG